VFNWVAEYPILIVLAALCRPGLALPSDRHGRRLVLGALAVIVLMMIAFNLFHPEYEETRFNWIVIAFLAVAVLFWRAPLPFAATVAVVLFINHTYVDATGTISVRSFFGVHKVADSEDGRFRVLSHGTTLHGAERIRDASGNPVSGRPDILMYYYDGSAMAQVMGGVRARNAGPIRYAVIGLGAGSLACRAQPTDTVHYYEIDPAIIRIARDSGLFHFLSACRPDVPIMLGDARLTLAEASEQYDLIVLDAFSSDAIPIHLMTREAMAIYLKKLTPHGIIAVHVSNRHLELATVVGGIAAANGAVARVNEGTDVEENDNDYVFLGTVVAVARTDDDLGPMAAKPEHWQLLTPDPNQWVWTDDYSNVIGSILRKLKE